MLPPTGEGDVVHALLPPTTAKQDKNDVVNADHTPSRDVTITNKQITLVPAYNEFYYYDHQVITSNFLPQKKTFVTDINV